jgi:hypothetical protein
MRSPRVHGRDAAAGGDLGDVERGAVIGPCPGCGVEIVDGLIENPQTGRPQRVLLHAIPFCTYYGQTSPEDIELAIKRKASS